MIWAEFMKFRLHLNDKMHGKRRRRVCAMIACSTTNQANMAGVNSNTPIPSEIKLHQASRLIELAFDNGERFTQGQDIAKVALETATACSFQLG